MIAQFNDGSVERIMVGEPEGPEYLALAGWHRTLSSPPPQFFPDYHRLQIEKWIFDWCAKQAAPLRILDIGAYDRRTWLPNVRDYRTLGNAATKPDIEGDLLTIDLPTNRRAFGRLTEDERAAESPFPFDVVLCTEVLEHCENPFLAAAKMSKLAPVVLATSPFIWPDHRTDDYPDYWRFTEQGWELLFKAWFASVTVTPTQWSESGACAYHLMRCAEGMGFAALTRATPGYMVEARN